MFLISTSIVQAQDEEEATLTDNVIRQVQSCKEMLDMIKAHDCGSKIYSFLDGGNVKLGVAAYSLGLELRRDNTNFAKFGGDTAWIPYYSISSGRRFWGRSGFGYEYTLVIEQANSTTQQISRNGDTVTKNLGTYALGTVIATQAGAFYSFGGNDDTPYRYATFGLGLGVGYASAEGRAYITENISETNAACYNAGADLINDQPGALSAIQGNCDLEEFDRAGIGVSIRLLIDLRYEWFYLGLESSLVGLNSSSGIASGKSNYDLSPAVTKVTFAYLFNL